jgi:hypothetical protein
MAAITQIRHPHSPGYSYYQRKLAEGKTTKEAIRALKRRISDALHERLVDDDERRRGPGGQAEATTQAVAAHRSARAGTTRARQTGTSGSGVGWSWPSW